MVQSCSIAAGSPLGQHRRAKASFLLSERGWEQQGLFNHFSLELQRATFEKRPKSSSGFTISHEITPLSLIHSDRTEQPVWVGGSWLGVTPLLRLLTQILKFESETDLNLQIHLKKKSTASSSLLASVLCPTNHPLINKLCSLSTTHKYKIFNTHRNILK